MTSLPRPTLDELAAAVTGRRESLFAGDLAREHAVVAAAIAGRAVLAIGGAGSIGSACIRELVRFRPRHLVVVDQDENALVELVRDLRSGDDLADTELQTTPLDFGAPLMRQFLHGSPPFDLVLHFAANKHVRAERDRCSLLQMLDTNLLKTRRLCGWLREGGFRGRFFCVSTDKAANPTNFLGASKRLMEQLVFAQDTLPGAITTSARFANVAFSNGSLLWGFLQRLLHGQPLATPRDTRRYFVTPREAGQLCLLAATVAKDRHVVIPRLSAARDLAALTDVAALVVRMHGRVPRFLDDAAAAKRAAANAAATGEHPILVVPRDTGGEKAFEEFVATGEEAVDIGLAELRAIAMPRAHVDGLAELLDAIEADLERDTGTLHTVELAARIAALVPQFAHAASDRHLDQRM